jgi:hypothetical protein
MEKKEELHETKITNPLWLFKIELILRSEKERWENLFI